MCSGCYASYCHSGSTFSLLGTESVGYWQHIAESFSRNCPWPCSFYLLPGGSLYTLTGWCSPFVLIRVNLEELLQLYSALWEQLKPPVIISSQLQFNFLFASLPLSKVLFSQALPINYLGTNLYLSACFPGGTQP